MWAVGITLIAFIAGELFYIICVYSCSFVVNSYHRNFKNTTINDKRGRIMAAKSLKISLVVLFSMLIPFLTAIAQWEEVDSVDVNIIIPAGESSQQRRKICIFEENGVN